MLTSEELDIEGRTYLSAKTYDVNGHLRSHLLPSGRLIEFDVNGLGNPKTVTSDGDTLASSIVYNPTGSVYTMRYGNNAVYKSKLNQRAKPAAITVFSQGNKVLSKSYSYIFSGRVTRILDSQNPAYDQNMTYDGLGQLSNVASRFGGPNLISEDYLYDGLGNIRKITKGSRTIDLNYTSATSLTFNRTKLTTYCRSMMTARVR